MTRGKRSASSFDTFVGLHGTNDESYSRYRAGMAPILESYGGSFRYDFRIGEVLKQEVDAKINRVFILSFPNREAREAFFADEAYRAVRQVFYEPAVRAATIIAQYEHQETA